jgi:2,4-dienoyl-CoA reductase-like NADH-dependent reductase (Old Yellow Enzyme family)
MSDMLFAPVHLKFLALRNRFVLSAASSGGPANVSGVIQDEEIQRLTTYAETGVGLIITGAVVTSETALSHSGSCLLASRAGRRILAAASGGGP